MAPATTRDAVKYVYEPTRPSCSLLLMTSQSNASGEHLASTPATYAKLEPKPPPMPMPAALTSLPFANSPNPQSSLPPAQATVGASLHSFALTIGVFVFSPAGEVTVAPLSTVNVPQSIIDAVHASVNLTQNRERILRSRAGTCIQCKFAGSSSSGLPTEIYRDPLTNNTIPELACKYCTLEQRPCVRRSGNIYDVVLAPLAKQFRWNATAASPELYVAHTKPDDAGMGQFVKKKDLVYENGGLM